MLANTTRNRFHLSAEEAELSLFGGLAASGWNTAALTMKMLVASVPLADGIIGLGIELSWPTPTYPDDVLRLFSKVQAIEPSASKPDRGVVTLFMETLNQNDKVVQRATGKLLVFRKPPRGLKRKQQIPCVAGSGGQSGVDI